MFFSISSAVSLYSDSSDESNSSLLARRNNGSRTWRLGVFIAVEKDFSSSGAYLKSDEMSDNNGNIKGRLLRSAKSSKKFSKLSSDDEPETRSRRKSKKRRSSSSIDDSEVSSSRKSKLSKLSSSEDSSSVTESNNDDDTGMSTSKRKRNILKKK